MNRSSLSNNSRTDLFCGAKDIIRTNVLTNFYEEINSKPPGSHIFQQTGTIFFHDDWKIKNIIGTNLLTKFNEDRTMNVASRVLTRINSKPPGSHIFQQTGTIFFHDDWKIKKKLPPPPWWQCFLTNRNLFRFELVQDIIGTNLLTKFNEHRTMNVASRVLTRKNAPTPQQPYIIKTNLLSKFHEDPKKNTASRVLTRKNAPPPGGHVIHPTTEQFREIRAINVASRVLTRKNAPPPGGHVFKQTSAIFEHIQNIIRINVLTKFHEDWTINVSFRVLTRKTAPPPGSHVHQPTGTIFVLVQDIIGKNLLTKFHDDRKINVASRVLTRKNAPPPGGHIHEDWTINVASRVLIMKNDPPPGGHVFKATKTIFERVQDIIETNLLTKFHENVPCREKCTVPCGHVFQTTGTIFKLIQDNIGTNVLTKFHENALRKYATPPGGHVFKATKTIFELDQDILETNPLTKFHDNQTINLASRVLTRFYYSSLRKMPRPLAAMFFNQPEKLIDAASRVLTSHSGKNAPSQGGHTIHVASRMKNAPPYGGHVFQANKTIFELIQDIIGTNLLTKFHKDQKINVASRVLTRNNAMFHEDWTINVASRVLTRFYYSHIRKNAPLLCSHVFQANVTIFELIQDIIETYLLTEFHEDWTINLTSRVLTRQMLTPHNARRTTDKRRSQKLTMSTLCSGELKIVATKRVIEKWATL
ncbi:hypothetical protein DPMN_165150 [Dreissena polymorpha]|uniref:Uncharacterized protein n=1 Tax=Dreissena polymorpha TaxID=45954 RepID=A0A9D4EZ41_DREPO|nr:hypothetical protein DPMN_165150 [Dreissena polymorpha]